MRKKGSDRIWPHHAATVGGMVDAGVIVRFACFACREIFDVDLGAIITIRGRGFSLIDASSRCKRSACRGSGHFVMASAREASFVLLHSRAEIIEPRWLHGLRPIDGDAPDEPPPTPTFGSVAEWRDHHSKKRAVGE